MRFKNLYLIVFFIFFTPTLLNAQEYVQCEDTCSHVHGIDLSHYQGDVFWETVGENSKMAYVYLKASEGGDRIDAKYERNIELAHKYGLKVGSYHFFRPKTDLNKQLLNFMTQCRPGEQDLIPMIDIETKSGLDTEEFCDSLFKFIHLVEKAYNQKPLLYNIHDAFPNWLTNVTLQCGNTRVREESMESTDLLTKVGLWTNTVFAKFDLNTDIN